VGYFDLVAIKYALKFVGDLHFLSLTHLDYLHSWIGNLFIFHPRAKSPLVAPSHSLHEGGGGRRREEEGVEFCPL
jgi:hypothetical protein